MSELFTRFVTPEMEADDLVSQRVIDVTALADETARFVAVEADSIVLKCGQLKYESNGHLATIEIDGVKVDCVCEISLKHRAMEVPRVEMHLTPVRKPCEPKT